MCSTRVGACPPMIVRIRRRHRRHHVDEVHREDEAQDEGCCAAADGRGCCSSAGASGASRDPGEDEIDAGEELGAIVVLP